MASPALRIGQGFDSHPYTDDEDRALVLGGVRFEGARPVAAHSDGDVVVHACIDALLGACAMGDIGSWFPDSDERLAGADSMKLLAEVVAAIAEAGWQPVNLDCAVVARTPRLAPVRDEMAATLGAVVGAPVSVKGKRPEGLGEIDGIACWAVALVTR